MNFIENTQTDLDEIRSFVMNERSMCVSDREWKFRLRGYGYDVRDTEAGKVLTSLPHGVEICALDA